MLANLITRCFQIVFGAVVLGLSITAIKWQVYGTAPATTSYSAFAGASGMLAALIGITAAFVDAIPTIVMAGVDGLASVLMLAGGIAFAVQLSRVSCGGSDQALYKQVTNALLNGGCAGKGNNKVCGVDQNSAKATKNAIQGRCHMMEADSAFLFLGFAACVAAAVVCFLASRRNGNSKSIGRHAAV